MPEPFESSSFERNKKKPSRHRGPDLGTRSRSYWGYERAVDSALRLRNWSDEELYMAEEVGAVIKGLRLWSRAAYFALSTDAAMAQLDVKKQEIHPIQQALLAESREVFALSSVACEEQIRLGNRQTGRRTSAGTLCLRYVNRFSRQYESLGEIRCFCKLRDSSF
jgi:hypothetical protein